MNSTATQSTGRGRHYARHIARYAKKNHTNFMLGILFLSGVVMGTLLVRSAGDDSVEMLMRIVGGFVENRRDFGLAGNFLSALPGVLGIAVLLFFLGFCAIAQPIIVLIPLFRGLGFGFSAASLYAHHGAAATGYVAVFLLPGVLLSTMVLILCCSEALRLSCGLLKLIRDGRKSGGEELPVKVYCARFFVLSLLCAIAVFIESVIFFAFSGSFLL